jgi:5-methylcytosine-specific restriction protein A
MRQHIEYERGPKNRAAAIRIHGTKCKVCNFDFDEIFGEDHAKHYIEIHHTRSISEEVRIINPETDLAPLCSNCHSMAHRRKGYIFSVDELKAFLITASERYASKQPI